MVMRRVGGQPRMEAIAEEGGRYERMDSGTVEQAVGIKQGNIQ